MKYLGSKNCLLKVDKIKGLSSINILIRQWQVCRFGAKRRRGHPKGGLDPLGSSDHRRIGETRGGARAARRAASLYQTYLCGGCSDDDDNILSVT